LLAVLLIVYFILPGLPNGIGVMRFPDSSRYEGEFMQARNNGFVGINHISTNRWEIRGGGDGAEVLFIPPLPNSSVANPDVYPGS
jgi:hypothetical protein